MPQYLPRRPIQVDTQPKPSADEPDLVADDTDTMMGGDEFAPKAPKIPKTGGNPLQRFFGAYWRKKLWTLPLTFLVIAGIVAGVPFTRYSLLAMFVKRAYAVTVTDSKTSTPVSGASVQLDSQTLTTDSAGKAKFVVPVGPHILTISKKYYQDAQKSVFVDLSTGHNVTSVQLNATGRQVPIKVTDKISDLPLPNVAVRVSGSDVTTGQDGTVTIVLPTGSPTLEASLSADGYTNLTANVQVTSDVVPANTFALVPAGRVYFLSNLSGKLDVVSTALDGSGRKTLLAGTGSEDANNTVLLASRDWLYLALLSKREGGAHAKLFLISTANNQVSTLDQDAADFTPIGWSNHYFVYKGSYAVQNWQPNGTIIKSFNAESAKSINLAATTATGTSNADAQYQNIWETTFIGSSLVYSSTWYRYPGYTDVSGQQNSLISVKPDGSGSRTIKTIDAATYYFSNLVLAKPDQAYIGVYSTGGSNANYYKLDASGNLSQSNTITGDTLNKQYPTFLESPSDKSTFWTELRDGKNTLFTGDYYSNNGTQIASLSSYSPYGWYTDSYLLVQKSGSELYIMPAAGGTPLKISDYYKPAASFYGYGGGYGGI